MEHLKALGIKMIIVTILTFSLFGVFYHVSLGRLFLISLIITGATYLVGDLLLLPRIGNLFATITDFGLAFLLYWGIGNILIEVSVPIVLASLAASFFFAISESLFHAYMDEQVFNSREKVYIPARLQTEFAEETDAQSIRKKRKE